jgi:hypothetical protein
MAGQAGASCNYSDFYAEDPRFQIRPGRVHVLPQSLWASDWIHSFICVSRALCWTLDEFQCVIHYTVGRTPWTGDQPVVMPLPTHRTAQAQNELTQTFIPQVEFEPTIPVFKRAKTFHALDRAVTVIGRMTG